MSHPHLGEAKSTQRSKVEKVAGSTDRYRHASDKADAYRQNENLDSLTQPTVKSVGP